MYWGQTSYDKAFRKFNFSPELIYSYGLTNISDMGQIERLDKHSISMIINVF